MKYLTFIEILLLLPISFYLTKAFKVLAEKIGFINKPNPIIETHKYPVAYGGGLAIGLTILLYLLFQSTNYPGSIKLTLVLIPVLLIGLLDDVLKLSPIMKLLFQIFSTLPFLIYYITVPIQSLPFFLFFILVIQNAWNLVDIMDGLVSGVSIVVFFSTGLILLIDEGLYFYSLLSFAVAFSSFGFRFINRFPAKIYLGETGSLLLGSLFAFILINVFLINELIAFFILLLGTVPLFELIFLIIVRTRKRIPFYKGTPDHFALRLLKYGLTVDSINKKVILICCFHAAAIIISATLIRSMVAFIICLSASFIMVAASFIYFKTLRLKN